MFAGEALHLSRTGSTSQPSAGLLLQQDHREPDRTQNRAGEITNTFRPAWLAVKNYCVCVCVCVPSEYDIFLIMSEESVILERLCLPPDDLLLEEETQLHQSGVEPHWCFPYDGSAPAPHQLCGTSSPQTGSSQREGTHTHTHFQVQHMYSR